MGVLEAGEGGDLPYQPGEALGGLGLHLDLLHCILPAVEAVDGGHHHPITPLAQRLQLLEITLISGQPCKRQTCFDALTLIMSASICEPATLYNPLAQRL